MHPGDERRRGLDPDRVLAGWERPVYMVHEHFSRSHHFDLRLEFEGVLRSWAVPKGLSPEPGVRRLAMEVPDHALSYAPFEGVIPEGSYGAGKVEVWDRGTFKVIEQADGKLVLDIRGRRIRGEYHLVRTRFKEDRDDGRKWLVMLSSRGLPATPAAVEEARESPKEDVTAKRPSQASSGKRPTAARKSARRTSAKPAARKRKAARRIPAD